MELQTQSAGLPGGRENSREEMTRTWQGPQGIHEGREAMQEEASLHYEIIAFLMLE